MPEDNQDIKADEKVTGLPFWYNILFKIGLIIGILFVFHVMTGIIEDYRWAEQNEEICRKAAITIQEPENEIVIMQVRSVSVPNSVQISYRNIKGENVSFHEMTCFFSKSYKKEDYDLKSIETENGLLSPSDIFFLNRFVLYKKAAGDEL